MTPIVNLIFCLIALLGTGSQAIHPAMALEATPDPVINLTVKDKPLGEALDAISQATGYRFNLNPQWQGHPVSVAITDLPLEKGLKRLLRSLNHTIIWESDKTVTIVVYGKTEPGRPGAVSFSAPPHSEPQEVEPIIEQEQEQEPGEVAVESGGSDAAARRESPGEPNARGQEEPDDQLE